MALAQAAFTYQQLMFALAHHVVHLMRLQKDTPQNIVAVAVHLYISRPLHILYDKKAP